jgi:glutamate dehydrogenase (NADP+)
MIDNGIKVVAEGANMPSTLEATKLFLEAKVLYGPAKAANAGGVATSGLEMAQNSQRMAWPREEVDDKLHKIMIAIHQNCYETAKDYGTPGNLVNGANIGGFLKVANAMMDQGLV